MTDRELKKKIELMRTVSELKKEVNRLRQENIKTKLKYIAMMKERIDELNDKYFKYVKNLEEKIEATEIERFTGV